MHFDECVIPKRLHLRVKTTKRFPVLALAFLKGFKVRVGSKCRRVNPIKVIGNIFLKNGYIGVHGSSEAL